MIKRYEFAEGKYVLLRKESTMQLTALRHDEPWEARNQDLIGDNLVHSMLNELDDKDAVIEKQKALNASLIQLLISGAKACRAIEDDMALRAGMAAAWNGEDMTDVALDVSHGRLMALSNFYVSVDEVLELPAGVVAARGKPPIAVAALLHSVVQTLDDDGRFEQVNEINSYLSSLGITSKGKLAPPTKTELVFGALEDSLKYIDNVLSSNDGWRPEAYHKGMSLVVKVKDERENAV